ncbi:hypothetical protein MHZ36_03915 [Staphylococcus sp. ACRSN]|uniref:hypothetical protein n=1 Tax=Staphylococcus sp. ACRSN TaxID=2918214 RepID=UPI001EF3CBC0|nr:hypothetical protein [Staphylococcus sp. ACRSN]MCG7338424.1 hypothetical protein [Staphylococcus sp. ACRSN]
MKYYNRDDYERNLESYEVPEYFTKDSRNIFVYGFIVGAVIGSAIGLVTLNKPRSDKHSDKQTKENQFKSSIINQTEADQLAAEEQVDSIKSSIDKQNDVSAETLAAQKVAIKEEAEEHNLADTSPNAQSPNQQQEQTEDDSNIAGLETQHIDATKQPTQNEVAAQQEAIKEETPNSNLNDGGVAETQAESELETQHIDATKQPTQSEVAAQQEAIKEETPNNSIDNNTSKAKGTKLTAAAAGGTVAAAGVAKAASDKEEKIANDSETAKSTDEIVNSDEQQGTSNTTKSTPNLVSKNDSNSSNKAIPTGIVTASGLAVAAKSKQSALKNDSNVSDKTAELLKPEGIQSNSNKEVPQLVSKNKVDTSVESTDKVDNSSDKGNKAVASSVPSKPHDAERRVEQVHETVSFKDGIISHDKAGQVNNNQKGNATNSVKEENVDYNEGIITHGSENNSSETNHDPSNDNNVAYSKNRPQTKKAEKAKSKIAKRTFND